MSFANKHIQTAATVIENYTGAVPLHHHLKQFFAADKKYGSKDRKAIAHACYCFYRLGHSLEKISIADKIKAGIFLCTPQPGTWVTAFDEEWIMQWNNKTGEKISFLQTKHSFDLTTVFPFHQHLSETINKDHFIQSHFIQPDLYLRIRPGRKDKVTTQLKQAGIEYALLNDSAVVLPNATKIDELFRLNKDVVVQDLSSQRITAFLNDVDADEEPLAVWDCCAASGGKSILAVDVLTKVDLTVSDVRYSIIQNLKKRFAEAGIDQYNAFVADIAADTFESPRKTFDLIICDAPCSGSGTWSRNPEQLYFFTDEKIRHYSSLQKKIVENIIPSVHRNGYLLYITCSVFREENEQVVNHILEHSSLVLKKMAVLKGYDNKADTMFAALFTTSSL